MLSLQGAVISQASDHNLPKPPVHAVRGVPLGADEPSQDLSEPSLGRESPALKGLSGTLPGHLSGRSEAPPPPRHVDESDESPSRRGFCHFCKCRPGLSAHPLSLGRPRLGKLDVCRLSRSARDTYAAARGTGSGPAHSDLPGFARLRKTSDRRAARSPASPGCSPRSRPSASGSAPRLIRRPGTVSFMLAWSRPTREGTPDGRITEVFER